MISQGVKMNLYWLVGLAILLLALTGCQSTSDADVAAQQQRMNAWQLGPLVDADGNHRSLALDAPLHADLLAAQPWLTGRPAWYEDRLDSVRTVEGGAVRRFYHETTRTDRDTLTSSNGKVQDNYRASSTSREYIRVVH